MAENSCASGKSVAANNNSFPVCLVIMDGLGLAAPSQGNAFYLADTPCLDRLFSTCSHTKLHASGQEVGLPEGQMGNSEVGHLNIGAGRVVHQELSRINNACKDGSIARNKVINEALNNAISRKSTLHFMGLLSDGGVHSSNEHLYALISHAASRGVENIRVHCFMDGRDVPPTSGKSYVEALQSFIDKEGLGECCRIASISGRYWAMDRDKRWERLEKSFAAMRYAEPFTEIDPVSYMQKSYDEGITDEFVEPVSFDARGIADGDSLVFFNFRPDRAREITRAFVDEDFDGFSRRTPPKLFFVCLTEYDPTIQAPVAFPKTFPEHVLADCLAAAGLRQFHIAETEKYAHVTFFFNGGIEEPKYLEERCLIPSPKVATYDLKPEMSEPEVAASLVAAIEEARADFYVVNFANPDMVGHTGVLSAAISAVEAVDKGISQVIEAISSRGGACFITADHGNCDCMIAEDGSPHTAHTTAPVPFIFFDAAHTSRRLSDTFGALCDIAPTIMDLMGLPCPEEMTGKSLFEPSLATEGFPM